MNKETVWIVTSMGVKQPWRFPTRESARAFMDEWKLEYVENCSYSSYEDGDGLCSLCEARFALQADTGLVNGNCVYVKMEKQQLPVPDLQRRASI
jgi:hypothetical protein